MRWGGFWRWERSAVGRRLSRRALVSFGAALLGTLIIGTAQALAATNPVTTGSFSDSTTLSGATSVATSGTWGYVTTSFPGRLTAVDLLDPTHPVFAGQSPVANSLIASTTVNIAGGYAYVVSKNRNGPNGSGSNDDGTGNSLTILDITSDPAHPSIVGFVRDPVALFGAYGIAVSGHYAFVAAQGCLSGQPCPNTSVGDSFAVVDVANPATPTIVATLRNSSLPAPWAGSLALQHATAVAISGNYAYVTASYSDRLTVIDISNPLNPTIVASLHDGTQLNFDVDVAVRNGFAYVADQSSSGRFAVVDVSNPTNPHVVGSIVNKTWLSGSYRIRLRGNFAYISAVNTNSVAAIDISDPTNPRFVGGYTSTATLNRTTGLDVDQSGRYVIASSPYQNGQTNTPYPPYPFQPGGPSLTGTVSAIDLDPAPISVGITQSSVPASTTTQTSGTFVFSVNDAVSTVRCAFDGAPAGLCTSPTTQTFAGLSVGGHTFTVQAIDAAGNTSSDSYSWTVIPSSAPTTPVLDNFNRANGAVGSNWSLIRPSGFAALKISANAAVDNSASQYAWDYWNAASYGPDCEAYVKVRTFGGDVIRVGARVTGGTTSHSGYYVSVGTNGTWSIIRIDNGGNAITLASGPTQPLASGDKVAIRIVGSVVTALHFTTAAGWTDVLDYDTASDSIRYTAAGSLALEFKLSTLDDFGGGSLAAAPTAPVNITPPSISGTTTVGQQLTTTTGSWSGQPAPTFSYQWHRCDSQGANCSPVGSNSSSYTLVAADAGSTILVTVTANNTAGQASADSAFVGPVGSANTAPVNITPPSISGTTTVGQQLTTTTGSWSGQPAPTFSYQWHRCDSQGANCSPVGSNSSSYTLVAADAGSTILVTVTANNTAGQASADSAFVGPVGSANTAPVNITPPSISGTTTVGQQLTTTTGSWSGQPAPTFSYQWHRCDSQGANCSPVGSNSSSYTLVAADAGSTILVTVTANNTAGQASADSAFVGPVGSANTAPVNITPPSISGTTTVGQQLTTTTGSWSGQPAPTFSYQWHRCDSQGANCSPVGSNSSSYTLVAADAGSTILVTVTANNTAGQASADSAFVGPVGSANTAPVNITPPSISGTTTVGQQLTTTTGSWSGQPAPTFSYQWHRCDSQGANCSPVGSNSSSYTLVAADAGSTILVTVTANNTAGQASADSAFVGPVGSANTAPVNITPPSICGTTTVGQQLTTTTGSWSGQPAPTFSYQWKRCDSQGANCSPVGSNSSSYTLVAADAGSTILVTVTANNTAGQASADSAATGIVQTSSLAPTTPLLDDFNRPDGAVGPNWSMIRPGFAPLNISSNSAVNLSTNLFAWDFWNAATFGPNCEAYVTVSSYGAGDVIRVGARITGAGTNSHSGYYVAVSATGVWTIIRISNGGTPLILANGPTRPLVSGDKVAIRIVGSVITALRYTTTAGWVQVMRYDTASNGVRFTAAGSVAVEFQFSTIDDFGGGSLP